MLLCSACAESSRKWRVGVKSLKRGGRETVAWQCILSPEDPGACIFKSLSLILCSPWIIWEILCKLFTPVSFSLFIQKVKIIILISLVKIRICSKTMSFLYLRACLEKFASMYKIHRQYEAYPEWVESNSSLESFTTDFISKLVFKIFGRTRSWCWLQGIVCCQV